MADELSLDAMIKTWHGSVRTYIVGFVLCLCLTSASFGLVWTRALPEPYLVPTLCILAFTQAALQLRLFLHLGQEQRPKWESCAFVFMMITLLIIVLGSFWIMSDLNERTMPASLMEMPHD
jgi:cytochrome o ubiquinol oxidase operon protein cyoD